jgi:hypothetical protein
MRRPRIEGSLSVARRDGHSLHVREWKGATARESGQPVKRRPVERQRARDAAPAAGDGERAIVAAGLCAHTAHLLFSDSEEQTYLGAR